MARGGLRFCLSLILSELLSTVLYYCFLCIVFLTNKPDDDDDDDDEAGCCAGWLTRHLVLTPRQKSATNERWNLTRSTRRTGKTFVSVNS